MLHAIRRTKSSIDVTYWNDIEACWVDELDEASHRTKSSLRQIVSDLSVANPGDVIDLVEVQPRNV
jgi:hypothetical protein